MCVAAAACSAPGEGRVVVAVTIDWEGIEITDEARTTLDRLRARMPGPVTHFVCPAYFTRSPAVPVERLRTAIERDDEVAIHVHAWRSLVAAARIEPRTSPSVLTGTHEELTEFPSDSGYETDLDVYSVSELRSILRDSRARLAEKGLAASSSFRAGGFLATPKVVRALRSEGFTVDSSAFSRAAIARGGDAFATERIGQLWPSIDANTQPFFLDPQPGAILEVPISVFADYSSAAEIHAVLDAALARLDRDPRRDVFVVLAWNLETAPGEIAGVLESAIARLDDDRGLERVMFTSLRHAADRARGALAAR